MRKLEVRGLLAFILTVLLVLAPFPGGGLLFADETSTFTAQAAIADSWLNEVTPAQNNGATVTLQINPRKNGNRNRAVLRFDLTSTPASGPVIPSTAAVKTSSLTVNVTTLLASHTHYVHFITAGTLWTETGVSWTNRLNSPATAWTTAGGDYNTATQAASYSAATAGVKTVTIRSDADHSDTPASPSIPQVWVSNPANNQGLLIRDLAEPSNNSQPTAIGSKDNATAGNRPQISVSLLRDVALSAPTAGISEITHNWTFPSGSTSGNYDGVLFSKLQGATAPSGTAADGTTYTVGQTVSGSEVVAINTSAFTTTSDIDENGADSIVLPGTQYTYKAYTHDNTTITGAATPSPPHYAKGVASSSVTTTTGGGTSKNWSYKTAGTALAPPGLNPNTGVVAVSNDNKVHSMSASTGVRNYQPSAIAGLTGAAVQSRPTIIPGTESTPSRAYDVVYVGSQDGYVYAFNAASGAQLWKSALLGSAIQGSAAVQLKKYSNVSFTPTVDLVIVGTRNTGDTVTNKIYGLNGDTGATVWTATYTSLGVTGVDIINSMPMIDYSNNTVWVTSRAGAGGGQPSIFQLNTNDGSKVRAVTLSTTVKDIDASPTLNAAGTFLYVVTGGSGAGQLVAVNTATGAAYASVAVSGSLGGAGYPIPVANGGSDDVYFVTSGASGGVYARSFDRTSSFGTTLTWDRTDLSSVSTPVFMPPPGTLYLYVGDGAGVLHKLNPATGADVATRTVASTTLGDPGMDLIAIPNKLYVGGSNGRIYSFDLF